MNDLLARPINPTIKVLVINNLKFHLQHQIKFLKMHQKRHDFKNSMFLFKKNMIPHLYTLVNWEKMESGPGMEL